jgi:exo-beta-1,3-glucanase (GH17 family)
MRWRAVLAGALLVLLLSQITAWHLRVLPHPAGDAAAIPLHCLSYGPFRTPGTSPFDPQLRVPVEQIEADLRRIRELTTCVRTYGVDHGLDRVPEIAARLGMRVMLGAWIDADERANRRQIAAAVDLARRYPGAVDMLIVGNEVLLRGELSPQALAGLLSDAREASPVPVAYADVWEFWRRHARILASAVDVASIHVLPYWEDHPIALGAAVPHVLQIHDEMRTALAPLPVFIGETGWPAAGRMRGAARPGLAEQTLFIREIVARAHEQAISMNLIEAFDQPWKQRLEGRAGGAWGIFNWQGEQRVHLAGEVSSLPSVRQWLHAAWMAAIAALITWVLIRVSASSRPDTRSAGTMTHRGTNFALTAMVTRMGIPLIILVSLVAIHLQQVQTVAAWTLPWFSSMSMLIGTSIWFWLEVWTLMRVVPQGAILRLARMAGFALLAWWAVLLLVDNRYRDLDWALVAAPMWAYALNRLLLPDPLPHRILRLLALFPGLCAGPIVMIEGLANRDALILCVCFALALMAWLNPPRLRPLSAQTLQQ